RLHAIAHRAHGRAQAPRGARGSGADVAAAVHGGLLRVARAPGADTTDASPLTVERIAAAPPPFILLWTGQPADTPSLVARVRRYAERDPVGHGTAIAALGDAARSMAGALERAKAE